VNEPVIDTAIDPVCGMTVDPRRAAGSYEYRGTTYFFCSKSCLERFRADPERCLQPRPAVPICPLVTLQPRWTAQRPLAD